MPLTLKEVIGKIKQATVPGLERSRLQVLAAEKQILWQYLSDDDDVVQDLKVALAGEQGPSSESKHRLIFTAALIRKHLLATGFSESAGLPFWDLSRNTNI